MRINERIPKDENGFPIFRSPRREATDHDGIPENIPRAETAPARQCITAVLIAQKMQTILDQRGDSLPEELRGLAQTCIEAGDVCRDVLADYGVEPPVVLNFDESIMPRRYSSSELETFARSLR
jgi:hypothetical protein